MYSLEIPFSQMMTKWLCNHFKERVGVEMYAPKHVTKAGHQRYDGDLGLIDPRTP